MTESKLNELRVLKISPDANLPKRNHADDAGLDLYGLEEAILEPGKGKSIRSGIAIAIPHGFVGIIADRSSLGKIGVKVVGGVIDSGYRGEIQVVLWNLSSQLIHLNAGDRIAQLLILPIPLPQTVEVFEFETTERGQKGFGSSGR